MEDSAGAPSTSDEGAAAAPSDPLAGLSSPEVTPGDAASPPTTLPDDDDDDSEAEYDPDTGPLPLTSSLLPPPSLLSPLPLPLLPLPSQLRKLTCTVCCDAQLRVLPLRLQRVHRPPPTPLPPPMRSLPATQSPLPVGLAGCVEGVVPALSRRYPTATRLSTMNSGAADAAAVKSAIKRRSQAMTHTQTAPLTSHTFLWPSARLAYQNRAGKPPNSAADARRCVGCVRALTMRR